MMTQLLQWLAALDLRWKIALGLAAFLMFLGTLGGDGSSELPPDLEEGVVLSGFQLQGEKPLYDDAGIHVLAIDGTWVQVRFGENDKSDRWFNFNYVAGFILKHDS